MHALATRFEQKPNGGDKFLPPPNSNYFRHFIIITITITSTGAQHQNRCGCKFYQNLCNEHGWQDLLKMYFLVSHLCVSIPHRPQPQSGFAEMMIHTQIRIKRITDEHEKNVCSMSSFPLENLIKTLTK